MVKNFFALLAGLFLVTGVIAQGTGNMRVLGDRNVSSLRSSLFCGYDAGTISLLNAQGNTLIDSVLFLPFGDTIQVEGNAASQQLDGDPDTNTDPGIMYLFYECRPSVDSATLVDISADPCRFTADTFFLSNGSFITRQDSFWVSTLGDRFGNLTVINDGSFQTGFAGGNPIQLWFAPATVDNFATRQYEGGANCIDVATDQAFSIIYLNEITVNNINNNFDGGGCVGTFELDGGLPQFDSTAFYTVDITLSTGTNTQGNIISQGRINAGDEVRFFVPESGTYNVAVRDESGSVLNFTVDMAGCQPVTFNLPLQNQAPGDMFCMPVTVSNFNQVGILEFDMLWDPAVLRLDNVIDINPALSGATLAGNFNTMNSGTGELPFSWFTLDGTNPTLADGDTIFSLCFTVLGNLNDFSPITFRPADEPNNTVGRDGTSLTQLGYIFDDGQVNISSGDLFVDIQKNDISCNPNNMGPTNDGEIILRIAQGTAPYDITFTPPVGAPTTITVNTPGETQIFNNLLAGDYGIQIVDSDAVPNSIDTTITIFDAPELEVRVIPVQDITCSGSADGSVMAEVFNNGVLINNPESQFTFEWNVPSENTSTLDSIPSGTYSVTVTNSLGCSAEQNTILAIKQPIIIPDSTVTIVSASCSGVTDGSISLRAKEGTSTGGIYTYNWEDFGSQTTVTTSIPSVAPGTYRLTVTDDNGCTIVDSVTVGAAKTLIINETVTDITCNGFDNGIIDIQASTLPVFSETPPYTFNWTGPGTINPSSTATQSIADSLVAGDYIVTMRDNAGCEVTETISIAEPDALAITLDSIRDETCPVGMDGFAAISVTGGTGAYTYLWSDTLMQTDSFAINLVADTLNVIVSDANACQDSLEVIINAPAGPQILSFANDSVSCAGDTDGALSIIAANGNGNIINYEWSTGTTGPMATNIINLNPNVYTVTITADDGCTTIASAAVIDPAPLQLDSINDVSPLCPGFSNGQLTVFASGGTMPYTYIWDNQPSPDTSSFNLRPGLEAGAYEVTIVDANNCPPIIGTATVNDPPSIQINFSNIVGVDCFEGDCDGEALARANLSDNSPQVFDYNWSNGLDTIDADELLGTGLCAGMNTVIVFDENGCSEIDTVMIPSPDSIALTLTPDDPSCFGIADGNIMVSATGGTPTYAFNWPQLGSTQDMVQTLSAGTYVVELIDGNGCFKTDSVVLNEPAELQLSINQSLTADPSCAETMDGILAVMVNTSDSINPLGSMPYTWGNGIATSDTAIATGLAAGTYAVTVTDIEGCTDSLSFTLNQPTPISFSFPQPADPPCFGEPTILMIDTIFGGAGSNLLDYTYTVDNNGLNFTPDQVATVFAGSRIITVEDFNGCTSSDTIMINEPEELTVNFNPAIVEVELGDTLVRLDPIINSTQIDSFIWSPSDDLSASNIESPVVVPTESREYILNVVDINGCQAEGNVFVELNRTRNVYIPNVFSPNGDGRNDEFRLFACKGVRSINFARVFDRWGSLLYNRDNIGIPDCAGGSILWDGSINNADLPSGVYVYVVEVEFVDNVTLVYRGDIAIIR